MRLSRLLLVSSVLAVAMASYYYHRQADSSGEFYVDSVGRRRYVYCYEYWRCKPENYCRPTSDSTVLPDTTTYNNNILPPTTYTSSSVPYNNNVLPPFKSLAYGHLDGRGNINVGQGRVSFRGRDLVLECEFHADDDILSNIVWFRKSVGGCVRYSDCSARYLDKRRLVADRISRTSSRLMVLDYRPEEDDGIYRCFATRRSRAKDWYNQGYGYGYEHNYYPYDNPATENVYREMVVFNYRAPWYN